MRVGFCSSLLLQRRLTNLLEVLNGFRGLFWCLVGNVVVESGDGCTFASLGGIPFDRSLGKKVKQCLLLWQMGTREVAQGRI